MRDLQLEISLKSPGRNNLTALDKEIEALAEELACKELKEKPLEPNALMTPAAYKERLKEEFKEKLSMREVGEALSTAMFMIMHEGQTYLDFDAYSDAIDEFEKAFDILMKMDTKDGLDKTFKELAQISDKTLNSVEKMALDKYNEKNFLASARLLVLLTALDSNRFDYWNRLGIVYQELKNYEDALSAYANAYLLIETNIPNHLFMAECHIELGDTAHAAEEYEILTRLAAEDGDERWKEPISLLEKAIFQNK